MVFDVLIRVGIQRQRSRDSPSERLLTVGSYSAAAARQTHPARKASPPSGVTAPKIVIPVVASTYRLPEKRAMPAVKHQPAAGIRRPSTRPAMRCHEQDRDRVVHVVARPGFEDAKHLGREAAAKCMGTERAHGDAERACHRTNQEEGSIHDGIIWL